MQITRWIKRILIIIIRPLLVGGFSFAQNTTEICKTCSSMAPELQEYISFTYKIIDTLNTNKILAQGTKYQVFGPWQGGLYNGNLTHRNPTGYFQNIIAGTLKNIDKRQSQARATAEIFSIYSIDVMRDGILGFLVIGQTRPIMRDFQSLLDIDTLISTKLIELGKQGEQGKILTTQERTSILKIFEEYSGNGKLFENNNSYSLSTATSSTDILRLILRINTINKEILVTPSEQEQDYYTVKTQNTIINLSIPYYNSMINNYKCVRIMSKEKSCGGNFQDFKNSIINIGKSFVESGPKASREIIDSSYKRLITMGRLMGKSTSKKVNEQDKLDFLNRENDGLMSWGNGEFITQRTGKSILTGILSTNIPRALQDIKSEIVNGLAGVTLPNKNKNDNTKGNIKSEEIKRYEVLQQLLKEESKTNTREGKIFISTQAQKNITQSITRNIESHFNAQRKEILTVTSDSQEAIARVTFYLRTINHMLSTSIIDDLQRTCNLQCSNLGGICG